ncbi:unnamed protein product [Malus baccata var. baccata]
MASSAMKGRSWTRKEYEALCMAYRWVSEDSVRGISQTSEAARRHESGANYYDEIIQAEELYMEGNSKPFQFHDSPQHRASMTVFRTASSAADMNEDESPTIQQIRVENPSSGEGSIPRAMGRNKERRLKEKGKKNADYAAQHEVAASL